MLRHALMVAILLSPAACGGPRTAARTPPPRPSASPAAPDPAAFASIDPRAVAAELVRLAAAGDERPLDAHIDWPYVHRLAAMSGAFSPTLSDLVATLRSIPARCTPTWRVDDGGLRLDFPPAMVDDPKDVAAEKDALKAELYQGNDLTAVCHAISEDIYDDGHTEQIDIPEDVLVVQLLRDAGGRWHIRGWLQVDSRQHGGVPDRAPP